MCAEYCDEQGPDWEEVQNSLKGCVILDLYKTFLLPKSWARSQVSSGSIQTGDGRVFSTGSVQTHEGQLFIAEEAGRLFVDLANSGTASFERRTQIGTSTQALPTNPR